MKTRSLAPFVVLPAVLLACAADDGGEATPSTSAETSDESESGSNPCDVDGDEFISAACAGGTDCNDEDATIFPGAEDTLWEISPVDIGLLGENVVTAAAFDGEGTLHALYSDGAEGGEQKLWHAAKAADGTWSPVEVTSGDQVRPPTIVAIGSTVHALIPVVVDGVDTVRHGTSSGGSWTLTDLTSGTANGQSLRAVGDGLVAVTSNAGNASWWSYEGGVWTESAIGELDDPIVAPGPGGERIAIGRVDGGLRVCEGDADVWTCDPITATSDGGAYGSRNRAGWIEGQLHIVSVDDVDTRRLVHRDRTGGTITMLSFLPSPDHGLSVVAEGSTLHIATWSRPLTIGGLAYARFESGDWQLDETVVEGHRNGWEPALAVDGAGGLHVVFADTVVDDLLYAVRVGDGIDQDCDGQDG